MVVDVGPLVHVGERIASVHDLFAVFRATHVHGEPAAAGDEDIVEAAWVPLLTADAHLPLFAGGLAPLLIAEGTVHHTDRPGRPATSAPPTLPVPGAVALTGGRMTTGIVRDGVTVRRPSMTASSFVAALLGLLRSRGFDGSHRRRHRSPGSPLEDLGYVAWTWCISSKPTAPAVLPGSRSSEVGWSENRVHG